MKKIFILFLSIMMLFSVSYSEIHDYQVGLDVQRSLDQNNVVLDNVNLSNNDIEITYALNFADIPYAQVTPETPPKEVVLILDTSGSMAWDVDGNDDDENDFSGTSRMTIVKAAAETFVSELAKNPNIKLGLVTYDTRGYVRHELKSIGPGFNSNKNAIISTINGLFANGGTNVGDAIRIGKEVLNRGDSNSDQFFVFLTDGEPTHFSHNSNNYNYYTGTGYAPRTYRSKDHGKSYAKLMTEDLTAFDKNYFVAFSNNGANKLQEIAGVIQSFYKKALTSDEINEVYDEISYVIGADLSIEDVVLTDLLPDGLTVTEMPDGMVVNGQSLSYEVGPVPYVLNQERTAYVAQTKEVKIKVRANRPDNYLLSQGSVSYLDLDDVTRSKSLNNLTISYTRDPVENVIASRQVNENGNLENTVDLVWDTYPGATSYNIYKDNTLLGNVASNNYSLPITSTDQATTDYYIEAVLADGQVSGKGHVNHNTNPSIVNLRVTRENAKLLVSFDDIPGVTYKLRPEINSVLKAEERTQDDFVLVNDRVYFTYDLAELDDFDGFTSNDIIKFLVDGDKANAIVYGAVSEEIRLKQAVMSTIVTSLDTFYYGSNKDVEITFVSESDYPDGINLYNPLFVIELSLPSKTTTTPLEYSYSTMSVKEDGLKKGAVITRQGDDDIKLYISMTDYETGLMPAGKTITLNANFGIAYDSVNGILKQSVLNALRTYNSSLEAYQIEYQIRGLLNAFYDDATTDIDQMLEIKTYMTYNTSQKSVEGVLDRDEVIGVSSGFITINNKAGISNEF